MVRCIRFVKILRAGADQRGACTRSGMPNKQFIEEYPLYRRFKVKNLLGSANLRP
jgi:hypothetical protein